MKPFLFLSFIAIMMVTGTAAAHPLGDNAVNRLASINIENDRVTIHYLLDMAEIPTLFAGQSADLDQDDVVTAAEWKAFSRDQAEKLRPLLQVTLGESEVDLKLQASTWKIKPGNANLSVLRMAFDYVAIIPKELSVTSLTYKDTSAPEQPGWKGVRILSEQGVELVTTDAGKEDPTHGLTVFPNPMGALMDQTQASAKWKNIAPAMEAHFSSPSPSATPVLEAQLEDYTNFREPAPLSPPSTVLPIETRDHSSNVSSFFLLGMHHIAIGWDHLAFLLGLFLLSPVWRALVKVTAAFTVAHSMTLTLAALGWIYVPGAWVEPAIAATVAYVGWLSLAGKKSSHGVGMAFGFGLVHGLGFAGAFAETLGQSSMGSAQLLDLLSFNVGIEVFQLALIGLALPVRAWLGRYTWSHTGQRLAAFSVMSLGLGWLFVRTF